ncbi:iron-siderophore ABC transporter substrate-binding protein [Neisseria leonii]|uniref:iron-siderophore ABC transporter substrate-binding protein n=1 Tax=Neisseria leonii TaxID=2995413 RepID=UPI00237A417E|nr:iron-siderophore ABC transporter substrate-binding protein [Neisseria sp. 3986]MDD9325287.1 iron-siderophore ABC transporter substrate-binding protein [Neisseria sp. 3986]
MAAGCLLGCRPLPSGTKPLFEHPDSSAPFPVVIHGALGDTRIDRPPQRVVALGAGAEDIALSLGVIPVAIETHLWGGDEKGYLPWFKEAVLQTRQVLPDTVAMYPELDIEKIIGLKPDLVLAPQSGISPAIFKQLSGFVPVVAYPGRAWLTSVQEQFEIAGAALGRLPQARQVYRLMQEQMAAYRAAYPHLQQYTFAYLNAGRHMVNLWTYVAGDPRVDALTQLGLELAPSVRNLPVRSGSFVAEIGLENADMLADVDIVVSGFINEQARDAVAAVPLYSAIPAIRNGAYAALTDKTLIMAMSYGTPLSLSWGIPRFMPILLEAAARVPAKMERL